MKFPRIARPLRSQFDMAPFACVFFLLVMFLMLGSVTHKPGVRVELPAGNDFPGTDGPSVTVKVDSNGNYYYQNQLLNVVELKARLVSAAKNSREPLTLVIQADKSVRHEQELQLMALAREAGIRDAWFATQPPEGGTSPEPAPPKKP